MIVELDDNEAVIAMVDSNLQREQIKLRADASAKYFPENLTPKQKTDLIEQLLKEWYEKQEYSKQESHGSSRDRVERYCTFLAEMMEKYGALVFKTSQ